MLAKQEEKPWKFHFMQEGVGQEQTEDLFLSHPHMGRGNGLPIAEKNKIKNTSWAYLNNK